MIRELFDDENGKMSSTRTLGAIGYFAGITLAFMGKHEAASTVLTSSSALLGIGQIKSAVIKSTAAKAGAAKGQGVKAAKSPDTTPGGGMP